MHDVARAYLALGYKLLPAFQSWLWVSLVWLFVYKIIMTWQMHYIYDEFEMAERYWNWEAVWFAFATPFAFYSTALGLFVYELTTGFVALSYWFEVRRVAVQKNEAWSSEMRDRFMRGETAEESRRTPRAANDCDPR